MIRSVISDAKACGKKVGICGQAPSDHEGFAEMLVDAGIDSVSLNPDSVLTVRQRLAKHEKKTVNSGKKQPEGKSSSIKVEQKSGTKAQ